MTRDNPLQGVAGTWKITTLGTPEALEPVVDFLFEVQSTRLSGVYKLNLGWCNPWRMFFGISDRGMEQPQIPPSVPSWEFSTVQTLRSCIDQTNKAPLGINEQEQFIYDFFFEYPAIERKGDRVVFRSEHGTFVEVRRRIF